MNKNLINYQSNIVNGNYITIDPGARLGGGTGIAIFKDSVFISSKLCCSKKYIYDDRIEDILDIIFEDLILKKLAVNFSVFIERPIFFDSHKGLVAAKSDSLFKLTYFYGRLFQLCTTMCPTYHLEINHWKGQLSKKQAAIRIFSILDSNKLHYSVSGDEIDAIGMGLYLNGSF